MSVLRTTISRYAVTELSGIVHEFKADWVTVSDGELRLTRKIEGVSSFDLVAIFAPGKWISCVERPSEASND